MSEKTDPRIVHVASELSVDLGPQAENDGNLEYVTDVIDAVDYANEQCGTTYADGQRDAIAKAVNAVEMLSPMHWKYDGTKDDYAECVTVDSAIAAIKAVGE